jgi:hypothetical protein
VKEDSDKTGGLAAGRLGDWVVPGSPNLTLAQVAHADPRLAAAMLPPRAERQGVGVGAHDLPFIIGGIADGCPAYVLKSINLCASFTSTAPSTITAQPDSGFVLTRDIWVRKLTYTVRRPNAFAGSIFKAQSDVNNALNPNVDFTLIVRSYADYVIASDPTPLETLPLVFECVCPIGFVVSCATTFEAFFTLRRTLAADEIPYEVCLTLWGITIPRRYDVAIEAAIAALVARGVDCC